MDAASIAITLCGLCIEGYRSFQSLKSLGTDAQVILSKIEIQEYRLQHLKQTLETIKRTDNTRDLDLVKQPVHNTLNSIKLLTTDATHLRNQYKLKFEILSPEPDEKHDTDTSSPAIKIRKTRAIKWLLFDKADMEKLAAELKTLTDGLEDLVALTVRHSSPSALLCAAIRSLATSDPPALATIVAASVETYPEIAADAERKLERLAAEHGFRVESPRRASLFEISDFVFSRSGDGDGTQREMALTASSRNAVLMEWRPLPSDFEGRERAVARLTTTSTLLQVSRPATMRTLDCPGYVIDHAGHAAALVYRFPAGAAGEPPVPLLRLLEEAVEDGGDGRPALEERFALAVALAETVFRLHMSGWLHRCVGAHNVLFFAPESGGGRTALLRDGGLRRPFLTGFEFSREGVDGAVTETVVEGPGVGRYRHPGCQGPFRTGFRSVHDLYRWVIPFSSSGLMLTLGVRSLGMVLLEIGLWKPFDRPPLYKSTSSSSDNRDRIVQKCLSGYLAHYTGSVYQNVVRTCLTGEFGCDMSDDAALQQRVYDVVLQPLQSLVAGMSPRPQ